MAISAEAAMEIDRLRAKVNAGTSTLEDMRAAVRLLRGDRVSAATASETSKARKAKASAPVNGDDLLKSFM